MSAFSCCLAWFVLGLLLGWLLGWWLDCRKRCQAKKSCCAGGNNEASQDNNSSSAAQAASAPPANSLVATPAERAEVKVSTATPSPAVAKPATTEKSTSAPTESAWMAVPALAALAKAAKKGGKDNLEIVEGIGPKIAGLLTDAGISTFAKLSEASVAQLTKVLEAAGPRYRLAKPDSWPQQAGLAAKGDWAALKALQDALTGGVKPAKTAAAKPKATKPKVSKTATSKPKTPKE